MNLATDPQLINVNTQFLENKLQFEKLKQVFVNKTVHRHHSATARCVVYKNRVLDIEYTGVINQAGFHGLDSAINSQRMACVVAIERQDCAMTLPGDVVVCPGIWLPGTPPSAIIVRPDQFDASVAFCVLLAGRGVQRMTFLVWQAEYAQHWCKAVSR